MTILTVRHVTVYRYRVPVAFGDHRMMFRSRDGYDQKLLDESLRLPEALSRSECCRHEGACHAGRRVWRHAMVARRRRSGMGSRTRSHRARENIDRLQAWGYAAEWITLCQVQELEPDIDPETIGDAPVAFFRWSRGARRSPVLS
jgi:hypothetical protein